MKRLLLPLLGLPLFVAWGCGGSPNVVGKYKAKVEMPRADKDNSGALGEGLANAFASAMTLELKADNKFAMSMIFPIEGKWSMSGKTLTLTPESVMGMNADEAAKDSKNEPMEFTVSSDGKTLTAKKSKPGEGELTFVRE